MKKLLCKIGIHLDKQVMSAPYQLLGLMGVIKAWVCKTCGYKCPDGLFVADRENVSKRTKL